MAGTAPRGESTTTPAAATTTAATTATTTAAKATAPAARTDAIKDKAASPAAAKTMTMEDALSRVDALIAAKARRGAPGGVLLVHGAPRSGKTTFARAALDRALAAYGDTGALMIAANRKSARRLNDEVVAALPSTGNPRIVRTIPALAFQLLGEARRAQGLPPAKLLSGAEQDALLSSVLDAHAEEAKEGGSCPTCRLLDQYFAVTDDEAAASDRASLYARCFTPAFIAQLRDMLARMTEAGVSGEQEQDALLSALDALPDGQVGYEERRRLHAQWQLAFALRGEYAAAIKAQYPGEFRVDSSYLVEQATDAVAALRPSALPRLVVVDDAQDVTLSGMRFLQALDRKGVRLVLTECCDESVQMFRGAYPELLAARMSGAAGPGEGIADRDLGFLNADAIALALPAGEGEATYRDVVCSRVSLSIGSDETGLPALPERPWKLADVRGAISLSPLPDGDPLSCGDPVDGAAGRVGLSGGLFATGGAEVDAAVSRMQAEHLPAGGGAASWNDMAVISHDNATLLSFAEGLRAAGIPTRYLSLTASFAGDPTVQGLLAFVRLAVARAGGAADDAAPLGAGREGDETRDLTGEVERRAQERDAAIRRDALTVLGSPLMSVPAGAGERPVRLDAVRLAMASARMMLSAVGGDAADGNVAEPQSDSVANVARPHSGIKSDTESNVIELQFDDDPPKPAASLAQTSALIAGPKGTIPGDAALFAQAVTGSGPAPDGLRGVLRAMGEGNPDVQALCTLADRVGAVADSIGPSTRPADALWAAWTESGVADAWQLAAVSRGPEGRAANERIDMAMRLFDYATRSEESMAQSTGRIAMGPEAIAAFVDRASQMDITADSLARTAPDADAVTLATPASALGLSWPLVWVVGVQQGVWPNATPRNMMFGAGQMARLMLRGRLTDMPAATHDADLTAVMRGEEKSFLVALTRATRHVFVSAVRNEETGPSDFLTVFMPELFRDAAPATGTGPEDAANPLPSSVPALIEQARGIVCADALRLFGADALRQVRKGEALPDIAFADLSPQAQDAVRALRYLAARGYAQASPEHWPFVYQGLDAAQGAADGAAEAAMPRAGGLLPRLSARNRRGARPRPVSLSPSRVDALWACPVCALLQREFGGPSASAVQADFGSVIHRVARDAVVEEWDRMGMEAMIDKMKEDYTRLSAARAGDESPRGRYEARRLDNSVGEVLGNIAAYFVSVRDALYGGKAVGSPVMTELGVGATFTLRDVFATLQTPYRRFLDAYEAAASDEEAADEAKGPYRFEDLEDTPGALSDPKALLAFLSFMAGGFADGLDVDTPVTLNARIDRLETFGGENGATSRRIVDYKTGHPHSKSDQVLDLQLACYQTALAFASRGDGDPWVPVTGAALFDVAHEQSPATYGRSKETRPQPALFVRDDAGDACPFALSDAPGTPVNPMIGKCADPWFDMDSGALLVPEAAPHGVDPESWASLRALVQASLPERTVGVTSKGNPKVSYEGGTCLWWALVLLSRVFFAASIELGEGPVPQHAANEDHVKHCAYKRLCPACGGRVRTVMGLMEPLFSDGDYDGEDEA